MILLALLLPLLAFAWPALAQSGYGLSWWTVDGGGDTTSGGPYTLSGTIGQPDAGVLSGGEYTLTGGFWGGRAIVPPPGYKVYLPIVLKNYQ